MSLENVQVGDLLVINSFQGSPVALIKVDRVTQTQVICNVGSSVVKYRKRDGGVIGDGWESAKPFNSFTPEQKEQIHKQIIERNENIRRENELKRLKGQIASKLDEVRYCGYQLLTHEKATKLLAVLEEITAEKKPDPATGWGAPLEGKSDDDDAKWHTNGSKGV